MAGLQRHRCVWARPCVKTSRPLAPSPAAASVAKLAALSEGPDAARAAGGAARRGRAATVAVAPSAGARVRRARAGPRTW
jgi:hypothetical protein